MVSIIKIVLFTKPTAEHQYLLRSSCHPLHTKRPFPFSLALRIRTICSSNETYNIGILNQEIQSVHTITHTHTSDSPTRISLVVGYHPATRSISSIFHKHIYILSSSQLCALPSYVPTSPGEGTPLWEANGMCRWMGSHFHDWIDYNGVAFSIELLEWGRTFSDFWGKTVLHISS